MSNSGQGYELTQCTLETGTLTSCAKDRCESKLISSFWLSSNVLKYLSFFFYP